MNLRTYKYLLRGFVLGTALFTIGALSNIGVEYINYGYMPVEIEGCSENLMLDNVHICAGNDTRLRLLDDWIYTKHNIISPGDIGIVGGEGSLGLMLLVTGILVLINKRK